MEKKLADYRARKRREQLINSTKERLKNIFTLRAEPSMHSIDVTPSDEVAREQTEKLLPPESDDCSDLEEPQLKISFTSWVYYILCFILWATIYGIFIQLQFGTVYLIVSGIIAMYLNTRTGPKKRNEVSAYSVFNKNCKSIDGTITAEQFEREIRYGPSMVR